MKKIRLSALFFLAAAVLTVLFIVLSVADYLAYDDMLNSAPYSVFLLIRAFTILFPALLMMLGGYFCRKIERKRTK